MQVPVQKHQANILIQFPKAEVCVQHEPHTVVMVVTYWTRLTSALFFESNAIFCWWGSLVFCYI